MKNKQVRWAFLPQDIAVLAVIFAAGAACFLLPGEGWGGTGVLIILCGALMVPFYHHGYRLSGQKGLFRVKEILLSRENKDEILAYLEGKSDTLDLHPWQKGGVLVNVFTRKSDGLMLAQYFDYADYAQGVDYPLLEVTEEHVKVLESFAVDKK